jgi:hypothetical protein
MQDRYWEREHAGNRSTRVNRILDTVEVDKVTEFVRTGGTTIENARLHSIVFGADPKCDDITISDIATLIDYLFITGSTLGLAECL